MTGNEFRQIRQGLLLTQKELAHLLGYRHKVRISEYERATNPIPVPDHIASAMRQLRDSQGKVAVVWPRRVIRDWSHAA
jgi:hypothetical protein